MKCSENDLLKMKLHEINENKKLREIKVDLLQMKMNDLYKSIKFITNAKGNSDKYKVEIFNLKNIVCVLVDERLKYEKEVAKVLEDY